MRFAVSRTTRPPRETSRTRRSGFRIPNGWQPLEWGISAVRRRRRGRPAVLKGFGRLALCRRAAGAGIRNPSIRRKEEIAGRKGAVWSDATYGDFVVADRAVVGFMRRVGVRRGGFRLSLSVAAPFVWRRLSGSTVAPFPHPPHRTGRTQGKRQNRRPERRISIA